MINVRRFEPGSLENPHHKIEQTALWKKVFEKQSELEKSPEGLHWQQVFQEIVQETLKFAQEQGWPDTMTALPNDIEKQTEAFFERFKDIEMADTIFHDIPEALPKLMESVREVDVWTKGDTGNEYQTRKIERSGLIEMLDDAKKSIPGVDIEIVVDDDKLHRVPDMLQAFYERNGKPERMHVVIYEDQVKNCVAADELIREWSEKSGVEVEPYYVRALTGHQARKKLPENLSISMIEVEKLSDAVEIVNRDAERLGIPRDQRMVLLDFDGALSDNRVMRLRQGHVVYSHVMKAVKDLVQRAVDWKNPDDRTRKREEIQALYSQIESLWKATPEETNP